MIGHAICPSEHTDLISIFYAELFKLEPTACFQVVAMINDMNKAFQNSWLLVIGTEIDFLTYALHIVKSKFEILHILF